MFSRNCCKCEAGLHCASVGVPSGWICQKSISDRRGSCKASLQCVSSCAPSAARDGRRFCHKCYSCGPLCGSACASRRRASRRRSKMKKISKNRNVLSNFQCNASPCCRGGSAWPCCGRVTCGSACAWRGCCWCCTASRRCCSCTSGPRRD